MTLAAVLAFTATVLTLAAVLAFTATVLTLAAILALFAVVLIVNLIAAHFATAIAGATSVAVASVIAAAFTTAIAAVAVCAACVWSWCIGNRAGRFRRWRGLWCGHGVGCQCSRRRLIAEHATQHHPQAAEPVGHIAWRRCQWRRGGWGSHRGALHGRGHWRLHLFGLAVLHFGRRAIVQDVLDARGLAVLWGAGASGDRGWILELIHVLVAGLNAIQAWIVELEALEFVVWRFNRLVGNQQHIDALVELNLGDFGALFVQQETGNLNRHLHVDSSGAVLHGFFLDDAQNLQCRAFGVAHMARTATAWAGDGCTLGQCRFEALTAQLHEAELADRAELHTGAIGLHGVGQAALDFAAIFAVLHVDEVDHDETAQIAQTGLAGHFFCGLEVGARGGFFDVTALDGAGRVHVDRDQCFGVVDDDGAARGQLHGARVGGFDLMFDLKAREQRCVVSIALHP